MSELDNLLASREMVLVAGSGGVGKTTIAAAMGIAAAQRQAGKVLVLTVDPARRLASALGLDEVGNTPVRIDPSVFADAGVKVRGELHVAMLDTKAGWDELIRRHAPDTATRDAVLANPLYQNITSRFVHSHDYLAMEQLHDLHATGEFDLVIVDTPPSRNALSILDAPSRMVEFFGSRLLRWLTVPYRSRLFTVASKPFYQVADRVLGSRFLQDIADFFVLFQAMESGFVKRARSVEALLADPRTSFVVVTTLETAPSHEARYLAQALLDRRMSLGAIVANRVLPAELAGTEAAESAAALLDTADGGLADRVADQLAGQLSPDGADADADADVPSSATVRTVLREVASRFDDVALVAARESERRIELRALAPTMLTVPWLRGDVHDIRGLGELVEHLRRDAARSPRRRRGTRKSVRPLADRADSAAMTSLADLSRQHSSLERDDIDHLHRLSAEWAFLADLCFADLLLYVNSSDGKWVVVDQVRPATNQTMYVTDYIGTWANADSAELLDRAVSSGTHVEGDLDIPTDGEIAGARMLAIPVRRDGRIIAVLSKEWKVRAGRPLGELERAYRVIFDRFVQMIEAGLFPFMGRVADSSAAPRVGDGLLVLDLDGTVTYVSPNANSALHRVGIQANPVGMRLAELGFHDGPARQAFERMEPVVEEFEQGSEVTLLSRCVPLLRGTPDGPVVEGGLMLVRDVTELRKRDRLLLSKDATIREIHHRVKNNLQTISSLLRLQARRLTSPEAKAAVSESVRRIRTIALVHESLSREPGEDIAFIEIVRPLLRLAEEGLQSPDRPVRFTVTGDGGRIPAHTATPLSVVLTELLQNAVDHGFPEGSRGGGVSVALRQLHDRLSVRVIDNGRGVEPGFDLDRTTGLGLSIVRTLVTTELNGTITMRPASPQDLSDAGLGDGSGQPHGTVVELNVPTVD